MASVQAKDTKPELAIRRRLWAQGYRYRTHYAKVIGKPDLVFVRARIAVFIDGDFWHGNAWRLRGLQSLEDLFPTNTDWWVAKIRRNMERDREVTAALEREDWRVLRFWESDVARDADAVVDEIRAILDDRVASSRRR